MRSRLMRAFLWVSVLGWGIGLGAKLFDLLVLAGAWSAAPPESLSLMPYGPRYPLNPGDFFQPLSAVMLVGTLGALISGWNTPPADRIWLLVPVIVFLGIWAVTPTVFWPLINDLYGAAGGDVTRSDSELLQLTRRWRYWDGGRVLAIAIGFVSSVRAISLPGAPSGPRPPHASGPDQAGRRVAA